MSVGVGKALRSDGGKLTSPTPREGPLGPRSSSHSRPAPSRTQGPHTVEDPLCLLPPLLWPTQTPREHHTLVPQEPLCGSWQGEGPSPSPHTSPDSALTQLSPGGLPLLQEAQPLNGP